MISIIYLISQSETSSNEVINDIYLNIYFNQKV